jgi:hypothetical protein
MFGLVGTFNENDCARTYLAYMCGIVIISVASSEISNLEKIILKFTEIYIL